MAWKKLKTQNNLNKVLQYKIIRILTIKIKYI